ncbi:MAG: hypothetical protein ACI9R3_001681 [Verrucomicrobiales bacterium]|jgi:hypothetical protein
MIDSDKQNFTSDFACQRKSTATQVFVVERVLASNSHHPGHWPANVDDQAQRTTRRSAQLDRDRNSGRP